jgi:hypothetical protein
MTEHYYDGDTIEACLSMAREMAECMYFNMNAYVWWYLRQPGCNLMNAGGTLKKKGYTMAQFSKFVRPGDFRVDATYQPKTGVLVVAFKGKEQNAVVVVNLNTTVKSQTFSVKNDTIASVKKYVTSRSKNMNDEGLINCTNSTFSDNLDAQSITTYITNKVTTGIKTTMNPEIQIFPNPASGYLQLSSIENIRSLEVFNLLGQQFITVNNPESSILDISKLTSGIYLIKIRQIGSEKCFRFIKE